MNGFPKNKKEWTAFLIASAISMGLVYAAVYVEDRTLELRILRAMTRALQASARGLGNLGIKTETLYFQLLNNNRLV